MIILNEIENEYTCPICGTIFEIIDAGCTNCPTCGYKTCSD